MSPYDLALKKNALRLADDHRQKCESDCTVSLALLKVLLERAGIELTPEEGRRFL